MAEENVIQTNIVAKSDMSPLIADLNRVTSALSLLQERLNNTNKGLATQAAAINRTFAETLRSTGQFSTHFVSLSSDVDKFGTQLDKGQLKLSQFFRVYGDHAKTSGGLIRDLAKQQVQLQNAILQPLGRNAEGLMQYNVHIPRGLDLTKNKMAVMRQEMQILNKVVQEGAGQLINWGKNTQWAGRQLTVGLTVPMAAFGKAAADAFKAADEQLVRLTKVYGGLSATSSAELAKVRKDVTETAAELAKSYGASFKDTLALAGDIAATGKQGNELIGSIQETTRLSVLGEVDRQDAMKATLAIQTAFKQNTQELSESINFLNAVENQTSTTLNDLVEAIPKAGPVIKGLGGDIQDLALYLTAMREGGINASEGANALKSGLASLINPTKVATAMFKGFGIDIKNIVTSNAGNLTKTILDLQTALDTLDPLQKQQALEQLFGKFQFARMNALFSNLGKQGSQTLQVLDLMKASSQDLASIAGRELTQVTESASGKYKRAVEGLKADLAGIGDQFLKINTTLINVVDSVIKFVDKLPQPLKQALAFMGMLTATAGPLIMLAGVLGNFFGYIIKGVYHFKALFKGAEGWKLLTPEILAANKAGDMAEKTFYDDARAAAILKQALDGLVASYTKLEARAHSAAIATNPTITTVAGSHIIGGRQVNPTSPYTGEKDTRAFSHMKPVATMTDDEKGGQTFFGVVPGSEAVNQKIGANPQVYMEDDLPKIAGVTAVKGVSTGVVAEEAGKWHAMTAALAMQSQSEIKALKREVGATGLVTTELSTSYQALLPKMTELTRLAANESALIVAQLEAGKLTVDQARAKIIALNAQIERMMVQTATETAAGMGRTLDVTKVPLLNQPVVDPNTGKSNMKELLKKGRTRNLVTTIARALGVKTYGAPYSIETTIPKRLNSGGDVRGFNKGGNIERFGRNKTVVSGPSSIGYDDRYGDVPLKGFVLNQGASLDPRNKDLVAAAPSTFGSGGATMTAMLTPKETVFGPGIHKDPALYAAVEAANNGYAFGGNILPFKKNYGRLSGQLMKLIASGKGKDAILNYQDKILMQAGTARASAKTIDEMLGIPLPKGSTYDDLGHIITAKGKRIVGKIAKPASGVFGDKESFEKYNKLLSGAGLSGEDITGYLRGLVKFGGGKVVGSTSTLLRKLPSHIIDPKIVSEIEDAIHSQYIREVIRMKRLGIPLTDTNNPYHSISSKIIQERFDTNPALRDVWNQWKTKTSAVNKHYFSELTTGRGASTNGAMDIKVLDPITGEEINIGKLVGFDDSKFYHSGNEDWNENLVKLNMGGGIIDPKRKNYGVPQLGAKLINRLTKKWKPKEQFWPQGHQYTLGNQDPLHGPLQIGRTMVPKNMQDDPGWTREVIYKDDRFARQNVMQQFPIGTLEDRGKYILRQYMAGNYGLMEQPGAYEALRTLRQKFTGKLYRGIKLGKGQRGGMAPLPQHIIDAIQSARLTGDTSSLVGQEFLMRRSSWSESKNIASYFGSGYHVDPESVLVEAIVKNRNIIPAGRMFPDLKFPAPYGQKRDNLPEQEAIFGGKFRILGFENGKLQVETVVDGARAMGGPVSSGRSYIVGEKGPEVFVPKANGSIVPNYALGGDIRYGKNSYGEQAPGMNMKRTMGMSLLSMIPGYAGYSVGSKLTGGSMAGGMAGGIAGDILGTALLNKFMFSADGATKKVSLLTRAWQLFTKAPGPLKIVAAVAAVAGSIKLINDKIMEHRKIINLAFGQTADTAKKIGDGFQFKSLSQQLKEARNELKAFNDSMTIAGSGDKRMNLGQLMFKAEDIKKEIEKVKKDLPELVEVFNKAKPEEVLGKAEQLKAQFIAGGMSSENATKKIYALIAASNDASMALSTVASGGFQAITDKSSATNVSIATFNKLLGEGNTDQIYAAFETANISAQALEQSLIGTKNAQGEIIDEAGAYEEAYNRIANSAGSNKEIGEETLRAFISQNKELEKVLNATDTLEGSFAKLKLYSLGIREDLATMNSDLAETLALIATQQAGILGSNTGPFKELVNLIAKQDAAAKSSAATAKKLATATKDQIQAEIDKRRENIDAIKKEADERKKALDQELSDSDRLIAIQKAQIEYQNALASGDFTTAAQAQLDIQSLVQEQQTELAKRAIDARAEALIAPEDARIKALENQLKGLDAQITSANNAASKTMDNVNKLRETLSGLITFTISATADGAIDASEAGVLRGIQASLKNLGLNKLAGSIGLQVTEYGRNMKGSPGPGDLNNIYEYGVLKQGTDSFTAAFNSVKDGNNLNVKVKNLDELKNAMSGGKTDVVNPAILLPGTAVQGTATGGLNAAAAKAKSGIFTYQGKQYNKDSTGTGFYGTGAEDRKFWYIKKADGGRIKNFAPGGGVNGPGTSTSDSIPALLSDGEWVIKADSVKKAEKEFGSSFLHDLNAGKFAEGGMALTKPRQRKPGVPYSRSGKPIGDPFGQYWGELSRFIGPRSPGMDIWGGTEIPGLKFSGKIPQMSDYWHQMQEQPGKPFNGPGMGIDKDPMRYAGSGASMGFSGNGAYGFGPLLFAEGGIANKKEPSLLSKIVHGAMKAIDPFKFGKHSLGYNFLGGKEVANVFSGTGTKMDYLSAALTPLGIGKVGKAASAVSKPVSNSINPISNMLSKVSRLWKTPAQPVEEVSTYVPPVKREIPSHSPSTGTTAETSSTKSLWDTDDWGDMPVSDWTPNYTMSQKIHNALYKRGYIGSALSSTLSAIQSPYFAGKDFKTGLINPIKSAWNYGQTEPNSFGRMFTRAGLAISNPLRQTVNDLALKINPKRVKDDPREYADLPYLKQKMLGKNWGDASYLNIFKNIGKDVSSSISSRVEKIKQSALERLKGDENSSNPVMRGLGYARLYKNNPDYRKHYLTQGLIDSIPGGLGALIQLSRGVHRSETPLTGVKSALERFLDARAGVDKPPSSAFGPGMYNATSSFISERLFSGFGSLQYGTHLSPTAVLRVLKSKGFINPQKVKELAKEYSERTGLVAPTMESIGSDYSHPFIQELVKKGYIGYRHGDAFTNWALGNMPGMGLKAKVVPDTITQLLSGVSHKLPLDPNSVPKIIKPNTKSKISSAMSNMLSKSKELAYKPINLINQYMNYFRAKKMLKNGMYHGSADLGRNSDGPFSGVTELVGDYARDPYYGMGFYGTSSKAEADLYAGGYNVPGQWGESYGSLSKITKIPFGRYLDFSKDLKRQNYGLWKLLGERGFMGAGENLGPLMNKAGMTGSIMPRINAGQTGDISMDMAKWIALNKPKGTVLKEVGMGFANGGMVGPKYNIPSTSSSVVNPQPMRYNNGGPVHKYDVGGLVVNAAPGQSEREIASMVVQMLDNKNMLEAAKSGGRNRT
jgi:TP901 family phage tail tape measure protein